MAASVEKALATLIDKYRDKFRGADCLVVSQPAHDRIADQVLQETTLQPFSLRPIDGAALAEMAEHANRDRD